MIGNFFFTLKELLWPRKAKNKFLFILALLLTWVLLDYHSGLAKISPFEKKTTNINWNKIEKDATRILQNLLKIKTVRGQETQAAQYLQQELLKYGIESRLIGKDANRMNLIAEIHGKTQQNGIILLSHLDTVEANPQDWAVPPFSGKLQNGKIYGRGAVDMKGMAVMELMTFLLIAQSGKIPKVPIMLLAVADEESGSDYGAKYLTEKHKELFSHYKYVINEGGIGTDGVAIQGKKFFNIQYAEKGVLWLHLRSKGKSGHGSSPPTNYASKNLLDFLQGLQKRFFHIQVDKFTAPFFAQMSKALPFPKSFLLKRVQNPIVLSLLKPIIQNNKHLRAMTSNTISITNIHTGSGGPNVIPDQADAIVDIRLHPKTSYEAQEAEIKKLAKKYHIEVKRMIGFNASYSPYNTKLFQALAKSAITYVPDAIITPFLSPGFTDSTHFRKIGLVCYGFIPGLFDAKSIDGIHGKDEFITTKNLRLGIQILYGALSYLVMP